MADIKLIPLSSYKEYTPEEMLNRTNSLLEDILRRRTVRDFSDRKISRKIIDNCIAVANSAPSGANKQP